MNESAVKRRAWVKNAIIIFLAVMLILTFFSNTIMNWSLPEVSAQYAQSGSIMSRIRATASVKANSTSKIVIDETRKIKAAAVRDGQDVQAGDILFYLEDSESTELKTAREQLEQLEKAYKLKLLNAGVDYYDDELAISQKAAELKKAQDLLKSLESGQSEIQQLNAQIKLLTSEQKQLSKEIAAYQKQISKLQGEAADVSIDGKTTAERITEAKTALDEAKTAYNAAEAKKTQAENELERAEDAFEKANAAYEALDPSGSDTAASLTKQIAELNKTIRRYKEDYQIALKEKDDQLAEAYDAWVQADLAYNNALYHYDQGDGSKETVDYWFDQVEAAKKNYQTLEDRLIPEKESAKLKYDRDMEDYNEQLSELQKKLDNIAGTETARKKLDEAKKWKTTATTASTEANDAYDKAKTKYTEADALLKSLEKLELLESCEASVEKLQTRTDSITEEISDLNDKKNALGGGETDPDKQRENVKSISDQLASMQHALDRKKKENALQNERDQIEIDEMKKNIDEQRALVEKYEANSTNATITAPISGQITSMSVTNGSETTPGQTLCEVVSTELGYSCEVTLNAEQAKRVRVGDTVTVTNSWWSNIEASITGIRNDPQNPGNSKIAMISVTGGVAVGQQLSLTIGERGQSYDTVVPNSAIREDNNGKFVLTLEVKSSPLGNRYIAKRADITVLASDDTNTAVSGLMSSDFVITTSTAPITTGNQVRLSETTK